jgi:hypothetical protein
MSRRFQFSLGRLTGTVMFFALAALFGREFVPFLFVGGGWEIGAIFGRPGLGFLVGFCLWDVLFLARCL